MKSIKAKDLKIGDIFTRSLKVNGREAFEVLSLENEKANIKSRTNGKLSEINRCSDNLIKLN